MPVVVFLILAPFLVLFPANAWGISASNGDFKESIIYGNTGKPIYARTVNQVSLVKEYQTNDILLAFGPAGTGKTYTAIALAVRALKNKEVRRIVLTRPAVEAGEHLGFLPGDVKEKLDPYLQPLYDALRAMIPVRKLALYLEDGRKLDFGLKNPQGTLFARGKGIY